MLDAEIIVRFVEAAGKGQTENVRSFATEHPDALDACDYEGTTALLNASWYGHADTVEALLDLGASIGIADGQHNTPLSAAIDRDQRGVVVVLLRHISADAGAFTHSLGVIERSRNAGLIAHVHEALKIDAERAKEIIAESRLGSLSATPRRNPFTKGPRT